MKKTMRVVILPALAVMLALLMVLPMTLGVAADTATATTGFAYKPVYQSEWKGSTLANATWGGRWVKTDGANNGCIQWTSDKDKITLDAEEGVLIFRETKEPYCKFFPGQIANGLGKGAALIGFDLYYDDGTYENGTKKNFSGLSFGSFSQNTGDQIVFTANQDGVVTAKGRAGDAGTVTVGQMTPGWNTIEMFFVPQKSDGTICTSSDAESTISKNRVFIRLCTSETNYPETCGITFAELNNTGMFTEIEYGYKAYYGGNSGSIGSISYLKPYVKEEGAFKLTNVKAVSLEPDAELYTVSYTGYDYLTSYVPAAGADNVLTVPTVDGVQFWKSGVGDDMEFYEPADTMVVLSDMTLSPATGDDLEVAKLGAAISKVDVNKIGEYTYLQLKDASDRIAEALEATEGVLAEDNSYVVRATDTQEILMSTMNQIRVNANNLIREAAVFNDDTLPLEERIEAFNKVKGKTYDITYSEECAQAKADLDLFEAQMETISASWDAYQEAVQQLEYADESTDVDSIVAGLLKHVQVIRRQFDTFEANQIIHTRYNENLPNLKAAFDAATNMKARYEQLRKWLANYNDYKETFYGKSREREVPALLRAAVDEYNAMTVALNNEVVDAVTMNGALQAALIDQSKIAALLTDIKTKIEALSGNGEQ